MRSNASTIAVIDYGIGNTFSILSALKHLGYTPEMVQEPVDLKNYTHAILPGVGAFRDGMRRLNEQGWSDAIRTWCGEGNNLMGICLGMQLLFDESEEFGSNQGLGIIPGKVTRFPEASLAGGVLEYKVPHIGWSTLQLPATQTSWQGGALEDVKEGDEFYFVHSYACHPSNPSHIAAITQYANIEFCSVVASGNVWGCQFHPERSAEAGLRILRKFCELNSSEATYNLKVQKK